MSKFSKLFKHVETLDTVLYLIYKTILYRKVTESFKENREGSVRGWGSVGDNTKESGI